MGGLGYSRPFPTPDSQLPTILDQLSPSMSASAPYSASVVAVVPILTEPVLENKRMTFHSAFATDDGSTTPAAFNYWPGSEPRAAQINDMVLSSAGVRFSNANKTLTAFCESSFINVLVASEEAGAVNPASDVTAIFFLTGVVTSHLPGEREFVLETGSWLSEV